VGTVRGPGVRGVSRWGVQSAKPREKTARHNGECAGCGALVHTCATCAKPIACGETVLAVSWGNMVHVACGYAAAKAGGE
jgi:hypothetical protein